MSPHPTSPGKVRVPHIVKGELVVGDDVDHGRLVTPALDLDELVWTRREPGPAFDLPHGEIIDLLVEVGRRLNPDTNPWLAESLRHATAQSHLTPRLMEHFYRTLGGLFEREWLEFQVDNELGGRFLDGWAEVTDAAGRVHRVRAFPPRLVHVVAGNTPGTAAVTIIRGALTKGVNLMKLGSDDPLTASAILRTMAEVAPGHPTLRSFSAVYWKGGDRAIENPLFRAQYFDKIVAWGGEAAIRNAVSYVTPGFELVAFDPKVSISILGHDALVDETTIAASATAAATDVALYNQGACASSRFVYAEGTMDELAPWCEALAIELGVDRTLSDGHGVPIPAAVRDELDGLRYLDPEYRLFGDDDTGIVVLSEDPVDFHPEGKVVNVVALADLGDVIDHVTVATQTIGIWPASLAPKLRDALGTAGMQRLVRLGDVASKAPGLPHDGFYPLARLVRWLVDDS
jgi:Acyl-CoA reductase (LuxC)